MRKLKEAPDNKKERVLKKFLLGLDRISFVHSVDLATSQVETYPPAIEDREGTIRIDGEWDREDLKNFIVNYFVE